MRYLMRQKIISFGNDFIIKDASGQDRFLVDGKAVSFGNKLSFQDMDGNELAFIRERHLSWGPTYDIEVDGRTVAIVKKGLFTMLQCRFSVDVPGPDDLEARGSFLDHEYEISRVQDGRIAAAVSKRWFSLSDTYGVEVADGENDLLVLATTVVIDLCCQPDRD
jgi:uncharacterized protein YxjI